MKLRKYRKVKATPEVLSLAPDQWPAFWPLKRLQQSIDHLFETPFADPTFFTGWPIVDIYEDKNEVIVKVELPGMKKEEIEVSLVGESLNISGERKEQTENKAEDSYRSERYFGRFHRRVTLPAAVEPGKVQAHYKEGVLTITCPKTEEAKRKQLDIKVD